LYVVVFHVITFFNWLYWIHLGTLKKSTLLNPLRRHSTGLPKCGGRKGRFLTAFGMTARWTGRTDGGEVSMPKKENPASEGKLLLRSGIAGVQKKLRNVLRS
jgi:hypothetical protein